MSGFGASGVDERGLLGARSSERPSLPAPEPDRQTAARSLDRPTIITTRPARLTALKAIAAAITSESSRGTGFVFLPVFMAAGALIYFSSAGTPATWSLCGATTVVAALSWLAREQPILRSPLVALAFVLCGVLAADFETRRSQTLITGSPVSTTVIGRVVRIENREDGRVRLTLDVLQTERPSLRYPPPRVRLTARAIPAETAPGMVVRGYARLMSPSGPVRPGGYDFAFESWFDGIGAVGFFLGNAERDLSAHELPFAARMSAWVENTRLAIAKRVRARIGGAEGEIAAALIAGVRAGIPEEVNEALRKTGLAHVLSISGLHMALVAATVMGGVRLCLALFPGLASRRPTKKYGAVLALLACALYLAISGAAVAAQRSFIMLAVMLVALLFDRAALTMRNLAIAALIVIAVSPHEVVGPSFQMSFGATAALIGGYAAWTQYRKRARRPYRARGYAFTALRKIVLGFAALAMTSLIAGLATTIYGVYHFHRVSPYALGANLLAMPVVSLLVMPWAVAGALLMPFGLDWLPLAVMGKGLALMSAIAIWISERSPLDAVGLISPASVVAFTLALVAATLFTTRLRLAAAPLALLGMVLVAGRDLPDVLVSEDGRLVAVRLHDGRLAPNRPRPNAFTFDNWLKATASSGSLKPRRLDAGDPPSDSPGDGFACSEQGCVAIAGDGAIVVHAPDEDYAAKHCGTASLIVIDDATASNPCTSSAATTVLTKRDLALRGSAAVSFLSTELFEQRLAVVRHSIVEPFRPWHEHRRYSRAARGLAPHPRDAD